MTPFIFGQYLGKQALDMTNMPLPTHRIPTAQTPDSRTELSRQQAQFAEYNENMRRAFSSPTSGFHMFQRPMPVSYAQ